MKRESDQQPATPPRRPDTEWALALAGGIEREVNECYDHQRKPDDEHALTMTHRGLLDLANALRWSAQSESATIPEAPRYVGGFCQDREMCMEEAKRLRSLIPGCDCDNYVQCWEPCGRLGHSAKHARVVPEEKP